MVDFLQLIKATQKQLEDIDVEHPEAVDEEYNINDFINCDSEPVLEIENTHEKEVQTLIDNEEKEIRERIRQFIKNKPNDKKDLITVYRKHKGRLSYADICGKIGDFFRQKKQVNDAVYFYDLAYVFYTDNGSQISKGQMYLDLYDREIAENSPKRPTESLYFNLKQAIAAFKLALFTHNRCVFFFYKIIIELLEIRNMIVRWHFSKVDALPRNLIELVYARGFVNKVLQQAKAFRVFINGTKIRHYNGTESRTDLARYLKTLRFYGVYQDTYQHNWVHRDGFMVRVKSKKNFKARLPKGQAEFTVEFTVGLTLDNPIEWNADGTPNSLKQKANDRPLVYDETNEILKLAYDGTAVFVVPAFRANYWFDKRQVNVDTMMEKAHFKLKSFDVNGTTSLLTFKNI